MRTLFIIQPHSKGEYVPDILRMIQNHNEGKASIDLDVIIGYLQAKKAMFPSDNLYILQDGDNNQSIHISDDGGKSFHTTITEREIQDYPIVEHCVITT